MKNKLFKIGELVCLKSNPRICMYVMMYVVKEVNGIREDYVAVTWRQDGVYKRGHYKEGELMALNPIY